MRAFKNREPFDYSMGLSMKATIRLLSVTLIATLIVAFTTRDAIQTAWTAIALCGLIGFIWVISTKDTTFEYLGVNSKGLLNAFAFIVVTVLFSHFASRFGIHHLLELTYYRSVQLEPFGGQLMHYNLQLFENLHLTSF